METQTNAQDLKKKITSYIEDLGRKTDIARRSESIQRYLEFVAKFHQYSSMNIMLILLAKPDATHVMGFNSWKKLNRFVKRGERGIPIFAPMIREEDPDDNNSLKVLSGFKIVYVFDLSQTEGAKVPAVPDWISPERNQELNEKLVAFANAKGITVTFTQLHNGVQGLSKGGEIKIDLSAGSKTIIHEICHSMLHFQEDAPRDSATRELEAEATAFVVARHFGIAGLNSPNYLALFDLDSTDIYNHIEVIQKTASEIIRAIETEEFCTLGAEN